MTTAHADTHGHGAHPPHLAHHFDTPQQQFESGKLGMWVFLATEILMFGGLFCAYSVYRSNHPEVFLYAHHYLDTFWGAFNTVVLLVSSFTMAWGVRAAQLGQKNLLVGLLLLTLLGGMGFLCIKAIEYEAKFSHDLAPGRFNLFDPEAMGDVHHLEEYYGLRGGHGAHAEGGGVSMPHDEAHDMAVHEAGEVSPAAAAAAPEPPSLPIEVSVVAPARSGPGGLSELATQDPGQVIAGGHDAYSFETLPPREQQRVGIFFSIYWMMTGLHGVHVLIGLGIIAWLMFRAGSVRDRAWILPLPLLLLGGYLLFLWVLSGKNFPNYAPGFAIVGGLALLAGVAWTALRIMQVRRVPDGPGDFSGEYFTPVDIGGLYWHLVDLIWIFLFPLLYLIH